MFILIFWFLTLYSIVDSGKSPQTFWFKVVSVARCVVLVVAGVYLSLMVRIQLNILAGYIYQHQLGVQQVNNNIKNGIISHLVQEAYLSICNNFVTSGNEIFLMTYFNLKTRFFDNPLRMHLCLKCVK